jgi:hypothetical protein
MTQELINLNQMTEKYKPDKNGVQWFDIPTMNDIDTISRS